MDPSSQPRIIADYPAKLTACMLGSFRIRWAAPEGIWSSPKMVARRDASGLLGAETSDKGLKGHPFQREFNHARQFQARRSGRPLNRKSGLCNRSSLALVRLS